MIVAFTKRGKKPHLVNPHLDHTKTLCGREVDITEPWNRYEPNLCADCRKSEFSGLHAEDFYGAERDL